MLRRRYKRRQTSPSSCTFFISTKLCAATLFVAVLGRKALKTTINISIKCEKKDVLDLAAKMLQKMIQDAADYMCLVAKKDNLKIDVLSD